MEYMLKGSLFCNGLHLATVWAVIVDLEFAGNDLDMPHPGSNYPCWFCKADRKDFNIRDISSSARWRKTKLGCLNTTIHLCFVLLIVNQVNDSKM